MHRRAARRGLSGGLERRARGARALERHVEEQLEHLADQVGARGRERRRRSRTRLAIAHVDLVGRDSLDDLGHKQRGRQPHEREAGERTLEAAQQHRQSRRHRKQFAAQLTHEYMCLLALSIDVVAR